MDNIIEFEMRKESDEILDFAANTPEDLIEFINKHKEHLSCAKLMFSFNLPEEDSILTKSLIIANDEFDKQQAQEMYNFDLKVSYNFFNDFLNGDDSI